ncbi:hypothetical protein D3C80_1629170 [compost metagenome]
MVGNSVTQQADRFQIRCQPQPMGRNRLCLVQIREQSKQVGVPDPLIMATRKHLFPEHEFEFDNNAIRGTEAGMRVDQVLPLLVTRSLGNSETVLKVFVPRPMSPINRR